MFTEPDTWTGGVVEAWVSFPDDVVLPPALDALWGHAMLDGPYSSRDMEPVFQRRLPRERWREPVYDNPFNRSDDSLSRTYAVVRLADGSRVPASVAVTDDLTEPIREIGIRLPLGALERVRDMSAFETEGGLPDWFDGLVEEIYGLIRSVWNAAPFEKGLIGLDASMYSVEEVLTDPYWQEVVGVVSTVDGRLEWHPPRGRASDDG
ncbi:MAG: hypothetical protein AAF791_02775 [Bacteroidota bacterium]